MAHEKSKFAPVNILRTVRNREEETFETDAAFETDVPSIREYMGKVGMLDKKFTLQELIIDFWKYY